MSRDHPTFIVAGGGTGGHLFPALAIAEEIRNLRPDATIIFVGTKDRIEARVVPQEGYPIKTIRAAGVRRALNPENMLFPVKALVSFMQSLMIIKQTNPDVVIGTGGYVCGPVLAAARFRGIPTVIHESNSLPGVTTKLLAPYARKVYLGLVDAAARLRRRDNIEVVGTPTRTKFLPAARPSALKAFQLNPKKKTVLVVGGSQGASSLNLAVLTMVDALGKSKTQLIWQTGSTGLDHVRRMLGRRTPGWVGPFIDKMELAYAAADIVVCRAGASTIAELTRIGKPAILVPYPHAAGNHQTHNALALVNAGAAEMIADNDLPAPLERRLMSLLADKTALKSMSTASRRLGNPNAGKTIAKFLLALAAKGS